MRYPTITLGLDLGCVPSWLTNLLEYELTTDDINRYYDHNNIEYVYTGYGLEDTVDELKTEVINYLAGLVSADLYDADDNGISNPSPVLIDDLIFTADDVKIQIIELDEYNDLEDHVLEQWEKGRYGIIDSITEGIDNKGYEYEAVLIGTDYAEYDYKSLLDQYSLVGDYDDYVKQLAHDHLEDEGVDSLVMGHVDIIGLGKDLLSSYDHFVTSNYDVIIRN